MNENTGSAASSPEFEFWLQYLLVYELGEVIEPFWTCLLIALQVFDDCNELPYIKHLMEFSDTP